MRTHILTVRLSVALQKAVLNALHDTAPTDNEQVAPRGRHSIPLVLMVWGTQWCSRV